MQRKGGGADSHAAEDTSSAALGEDPSGLLAAVQQRAPRQRKASRDAQLESQSQGRVGSAGMLKACSVEALLDELQHKQQECRRSQQEMQVRSCLSLMPAGLASFRIQHFVFTQQSQTTQAPADFPRDTHP